MHHDRFPIAWTMSCGPFDIVDLDVWTWVGRSPDGVIWLLQQLNVDDPGYPEASTVSLARYDQDYMRWDSIFYRRYSMVDADSDEVDASPPVSDADADVQAIIDDLAGFLARQGLS